MSRFLKFCIAGTIGFAVDAGLLQLLARGAGVDPYLARVGSFLAAATATWWINRRYTFDASRAPSGSEWTAYVGLMGLGAAVNYGIYAACITWWAMAREHLWLGVAIGSIAGLGINFMTSRSLFGRAPAPVPPPVIHPAFTAGPTVDFTCNVCGTSNRGAPLAYVENRENQSCGRCTASLRMRSLMYLLSMELFGKPMTVPEFPFDRSITGLGMSDWEGYANALAARFSYTNTFYDREPRLDISAIPDAMAGTQRFLISSDVFEHIPLFALDRAFANSRRLLRPDGLFLFTVPFAREGETREHYPRLHDFAIVEEAGKRRLRNRTAEGEEEMFDDLVFHGGEGMTLEMRMFSESDLLRRLAAAGFSSARVHGEHYPRFGILWPIDHSLPIVARA